MYIAITKVAEGYRIYEPYPKITFYTTACSRDAYGTLVALQPGLGP